MREQRDAEAEPDAGDQRGLRRGSRRARARIARGTISRPTPTRPTRNAASRPIVASERHRPRGRCRDATAVRIAISRIAIRSSTTSTPTTSSRRRPRTWSSSKARAMIVVRWRRPARSGSRASQPASAGYSERAQAGDAHHARQEDRRSRGARGRERVRGPPMRQKRGKSHERRRRQLDLADPPRRQRRRRVRHACSCISPPSTRTCVASASPTKNQVAKRFGSPSGVVQ